MTPIGHLSGTARPTLIAKKMITKAMYIRGRQFLLAGLLLNERIGKEYVYLHLICQGLEIALKSTLLHKDYDHFKLKLSKPIGHNLEKAVREYLSAYHITDFDIRTLKEISGLNSFYKNHRLRYASAVDILIDPHTIESDLTIDFISNLIETFDKEFKV